MLTEIYKAMPRQTRRRYDRVREAMSPRAQRALDRHVELIGAGRRGLRARLCHYLLDRSVGFSRRKAWAMSKEWLKL